MTWRGRERLETYFAVRCGDGDTAVPGGSQRYWLWSAQHLACCPKCQLCSLTAARSPASGAWLKTHRSSCYAKATASPGPPQELPLTVHLRLLDMFNYPDVPASSELFLWAKASGELVDDTSHPPTPSSRPPCPQLLLQLCNKSDLLRGLICGLRCFLWCNYSHFASYQHQVTEHVIGKTGIQVFSGAHASWPQNTPE